MNKKARRRARHPAVLDTLGAPTDPAETRRAPRCVRRRLHLPTRRLPLPIGRRTVTVMVALVLMLAATTTWMLTTEPTPHTADLAQPEPTAAAPHSGSAPEQAPSCTSTPGDHNSAAGVIAAFEHAYYVQRSAAAAHIFVTHTSSVLPPDQLQPVIDALPADTTHCLHVTALTDTVSMMVLTEQRPGQPPTQYTHTVTTKKVDNRWYIESFT